LEDAPAGEVFTGVMDRRERFLRRQTTFQQSLTTFCCNLTSFQHARRFFHDSNAAASSLSMSAAALRAQFHVPAQRSPSGAAIAFEVS
jgi:hypothetical protein